MSTPSDKDKAERVSVRDANQGFSRLISRVEEGARFIVTKNNRPVARIEPAERDDDDDAARRRTAIARLDDLMKGGRRSKGG